MMWELSHRALLTARAAALPVKISVVQGTPESHLRSETIPRYLSECLKRWLIIPMHQDGEVVDVYLQAKRDGSAAKRFFRRLLRSHGGEPRKIVTDKLRSYRVANRELIPEKIDSTEQYENNRAEQSHEATRERGMRKFKSVRQAQRFLCAHAAVSNFFNPGRHHVRAEHYSGLEE